MDYQLPPPLTPEYVYYNPMSQFPQNYSPQGHGVLVAPIVPTPSPPPEQVAAQALAAAQAQPSGQPQQVSVQTPPNPNAIVIPPPAPTIQLQSTSDNLEKPKEPDQHPIPETVKEIVVVKPHDPSQPVHIDVLTRPVDPCCSLPVSGVCFGAVGLTAFLIIVTITSVMVFGSGHEFCNGYVSCLCFFLGDFVWLNSWFLQWRLDKSFQLSGLVRAFLTV